MLLSFNKILLLLAILAAVWYGFKLVNRLDRARKTRLRERGEGGRRPRWRGGRESEGETIELVRGEDGESFVARDPGRKRRS